MRKSTSLIFLVIFLLITNIISFGLSYYLYRQYKSETDESKSFKSANSELLSDNEDLEDMVSDMESIIYDAEESLDADLNNDDRIGEEADESEEDNCYHISTDGEFYVTSPCEDELLDATFSIAGRGRVFEALFKVRIKDEDGSELYDGMHMTEGGYKDNLDAFSDAITWTPPASSGTGVIEFYINSAADGSEVVMVSFSIRY